MIDFDFERLNFKWDAAKRKVTMNRGYLSEFLRSHGVTALPGIPDLMDMLAQLYVLHIRAGRVRIPSMEACLKAHGIGVNFHDPATITPARREMDNHMDAVLLEARTRAREATDPMEFWRWLDAEVAPIQERAEEAGELDAFESRYREVLQMAKDAGLTDSH